MKVRDEKLLLPILQWVALLFFAALLIRWLYPKRDVLYTVFFLFFTAFVIAYMLNPLVVYFSRRNVPRPAAVLFIFLVLFGGLSLLFISLVPSIVAEIQGIMDRVPGYTLRLQNFFTGLHRDYHRFNMPEGVRSVIDEGIQDLEQTVISLFDNIIGKIIHFFEGFVILLLLPILTYYFLRDFDHFKQAIKDAIPLSHREKTALLVKDMDVTLGAYIRGILLISSLVGMLVYIGLLALQVEFALVLAIITGITNLIPFFGPFIGAIPAVFIAFLSSPLLALKVIVLIFVIQQIESQVIAPPILGRSMGLHPLLILFALILGGRLLGLLGLIIALPLTALLRIVYRHAVHWHNGS
jgi:predicted PurR-regulated permease PerM